MFLLDDLFGIKLWSENIFRRLSNHLSNNNYDSKRNPLLYGPMDLIEDVSKLQELDLPNIQSLNTTWFGKMEGHYSCKSTIYFNDMSISLQNTLCELGTQFIPTFESLCGDKLELGHSNFKAIMIRYEGPESKFDMHYDTEHKDSYRCLILYKGRGEVPPFCYEDNGLKQIHLKEGQGIFFRGTTTYHGVFPSGNENTIRYLVGFQYQKIGTIQPKTLCSELRGKSIFHIIGLFLPYILYYQTLSYVTPNIPYTLIPFMPMLFRMGNHNLKSFLRFYMFVLLCTFKPVYSLCLCYYFTNT